MIRRVGVDPDFGHPMPPDGHRFFLLGASCLA